VDVGAGAALVGVGAASGDGLIRLAKVAQRQTRASGRAVRIISLRFLDWLLNHCI